MMATSSSPREEEDDEEKKRTLASSKCTAVRRVWAFFIAELIYLAVALAASAGALEIVGQQLGDNSIIRANAFGPLALHVDHELRGLVVGFGPIRSPMALLRTGGGHKDYDARYEAHQVQNSVTHRPSRV